MSKYNVIYESNENIHGVVPRANDWVNIAAFLK